MAKKVLVVDDEKLIVKGIRFSLMQDGMEVDCAYDGEEALTMAKAKEYDIILLDVMLPKMDGFEVCQQIREFSTVPIVMLTARGEDMDKILGLEYGADDYITKPFSLSLLYAKTAALIKRSRGSVLSGNFISLAGISVELSSRKAYAGKREISLTPKEYSLLVCLMKNKNTVMSREQLLVKCWGYDYEGEARAVDTHIKRLREKLGEHAGCIKTVIKAGYRLEE